MMNVPHTILDDFLALYDFGSHYLKAASEDFPALEGSFSINQSTYLQENIFSGHLNMVDLLICYNQLMYVGLGNGLQHAKIAKLKHISYDFFLEVIS